MGDICNKTLWKPESNKTSSTSILSSSFNRIFDFYNAFTPDNECTWSKEDAVDFFVHKSNGRRTEAEVEIAASNSSSK